jgi:hypothetical protein
VELLDAGHPDEDGRAGAAVAVVLRQVQHQPVLWRGMIFGETPRFPDLIPIRLGDLVCAAETKAWTL